MTSVISQEQDLCYLVAQEALDLGFDGWMIETHINPDSALTDKLQQVTPTRLFEILNHLQPRFSKVTDELSA